MRSYRFLVLLACVVAMGCLGFAAEKGLGIHDVSRITFVAPMRVGDVVLPAGDYVVRHTMQGEEHIMVFESVKDKSVAAKAKCTLVPLNAKAGRTESIYQLNAANERVLQELVFRGDTAKHVF